MTRLIAAAPSAPLWTSLESAVRSTFRSLSAPAADHAAFEALESEQARIRAASRHWLVG